MTDERDYEIIDDERVSRLSGGARGVEDDEVVREYEARYMPSRGEKEKRKRQDLPPSYSTLRVSDEEKLWAAVAHGSVWLTMLMSVLSSGFLVPLSVFVPLVIYGMFRKRSDYVAFHAMQAFVIQLIGTVGVFALLTVGGLVWLVGLVVCILAVVVLIGIILLPVWGLVGLVFFLVCAALPFATLFFGTIAMIETYNGRDYRYPWIARWVDRQLSGGLLNAM